MSHSADRPLVVHATETLNRMIDQRNSLVMDKQTKTPEFRRAHRNYIRVALLWVALVKAEDAAYLARKGEPS